MQMSYTHRALHMFAEKCLRYNVIRVVNNSPLCILDKLNTHSLTGFANYAKHIFIQKYQDKCKIQNCYIVYPETMQTQTGKLLKSIYMSLKHLQYTILNTQQNMGINTYIHTHTYMYKYIETHNIHITIAHRCINSCTRMDYHIF